MSGKFVLKETSSGMKFDLKAGNGEVILSADTAASVASEGGWPAADEQLLYVVHGVLHFDSKGWRTLPMLVTPCGMVRATGAS